MSDAPQWEKKQQPFLGFMISIGQLWQECHKLSSIFGIPWISKKIIGPWTLPSNSECLKSYIWCLKAQEGNLDRVCILLQVSVISVVTQEAIIL